MNAAGELFVYEEDGTIDRYNDALVNEGEASVQAGLAAGAKGAPGLAVDSEGDLYVGLSSGGGMPVVSKLEGMTGKVLIPDLDGEDSTGVAVNTMDVPANEVDEQNDVYVVNVGSIAVFGPEVAGVPGGLIERFSAPGLLGGAGVAVDGRTGVVYVSDAAADDVDVFGLEGPGVPTIEGLSVGAAVPSMADARRLSAQINPTDSDTHYEFEYGSWSCAATPWSCTESASVDIGGEGFSVGKRVSSCVGCEAGCRLSLSSGCGERVRHGL